MADKKISSLTGATTPLAGTEILPIVQSGSTVKVAVSDLTTGRPISATQLTLTTGNLIVSNGKGIDFSATPGTGTSELLADYEEGTWTPGQGDFTVVGTFTSSGTYTKVGRSVTAIAVVSGSTSIAGNPGQQITGLPFVPARESAGSCAYVNRGGGGFMQAFPNNSIFSSGTGVSTSGLIITVTYEV